MSLTYLQGGSYGENLAQGYTSPTLAIDGWANEESDYDYEKRKFTTEAGHFTQLVWKNTTAVGCGAADCDEVGSASIVQEAIPLEPSARMSASLDKAKEVSLGSVALLDRRKITRKTMSLGPIEGVRVPNYSSRWSR
jgi:hypothetical protein